MRHVSNCYFFPLISFDGTFLSLPLLFLHYVQDSRVKGRLKEKFGYIKKVFTMQLKHKFVYLALSCVLLLNGVALLITVLAQAPQQARIAFTSNRDGNLEIYVMDVDGKNLRNLTNHSADDGISDWFDPAFARPVSSAGKLGTVWGRLKTLE
jgi:hypothetical protein